MYTNFHILTDFSLNFKNILFLFSVLFHYLREYSLYDLCFNIFRLLLWPRKLSTLVNIFECLKIICILFLEVIYVSLHYVRVVFLIFFFHSEFVSNPLSLSRRKSQVIWRCSLETYSLLSLCLKKIKIIKFYLLRNFSPESAPCEF